MRARRHAALLMFCILQGILLSVSTGWAVPVRVRGGAQLRAQARFLGEEGMLELRGQLGDDALAPIEGAWIEVSTQGTLEVAEAGGCPTPRVSVAPLRRGDPTALRVQSAGGGEFCLRWRAPPPKGELALRFAGDSYHAAAELAVSFDRARSQKLATYLRFEPRPVVVDLDKEEATFTLVLELASSSYVLTRGLPVILRGADGKELARGAAAGDGKARLTVETAAMGPPGQGELVAEFAGNEQLEPASDRQLVTRAATARLALVSAPSPADPGDTGELSLRVDSGQGPIDGGVVEALVDGSSVGSAAVEEGRAELTIQLHPSVQRGPVPLVVRYLPATPWYRAGSPLAVELPLAEPSLLLRALLALVVVAAAAWVTISWRRAKKLPTLAGAKPPLAPGVHVIEAGSTPNRWSGNVFDAHDGVPLGGVEVRVKAPTLEGDGVLFETTTAADGSFAFALDERPEAAEIVASSATHAEERTLLPAGGTLRIALVTRRRALLRRLVSWARARGKPFDVRPEPTPAHVAAAAGEREEVRRWAREVEAAAFGPAQVDRALEERIREREPRPDGHGP